MKLLKNIGLIFMAALLFSGTVGIRVFQHACKADGYSYSVLIKTEHECAPEEVVIESCCMADAEEEPAADETCGESSCCSDQDFIYRIADEYQQESETQIHHNWIAAQPVSVVPVVHGIVHFPEKQYSTPVSEPPPISGADLIIRHQVFRL